MRGENQMPLTSDKNIEYCILHEDLCTFMIISGWFLLRMRNVSVKRCTEDRRCTYKRGIEARSCNHCCTGKTMTIAYFECNAHAPYYLACPALQYFSTLSHKRHDFRKKKKLPNTKCVFWFSLQVLYETFLILRKTERDMIINMCWSSCNVPVMFVKF